MKKATLLLIMLTLFFTVVFTACDNNSIEQSVTNNTEQNSINRAEPLDVTRYYHVQSFNLDIEITQGNFFLHQERLHLYMLEVDAENENSEFVLITFNADGSNKRELFRTALDETVDFFHILGFDKHENGYISLVTHELTISYPYTREDYFAGIESLELTLNYIYRRISHLGEIVSAINIDAFNNDERQFNIFDIAFGLNENAVAFGWWATADFDFSAADGINPEESSGFSFFLFDDGITGSFHKIDNEIFLTEFNRTHDGQVIIPARRWNPYSDITMFRIIDFENTAVVAGPIIKAESSIDSVDGVFPAPETSLFDFYFIGNEHEVFGYRKSDESFTPLFNFLELGLSLADGGLNKHSFLPWDNGQITIVNRMWNSSLHRHEYALYLLTPSDEPLS